MDLIKSPINLIKFLLIALLLQTSSCCKKDIDAIGEAQNCLDQATADNASECMSKVDGINSPQAYMIRCVAVYIDQGLGSPATLAQMVNNFKNGSTGDTSGNTNQVLDVLAFSEPAGTDTASAQARLTQATTARDYCVQSGSPGLTLLSTASYMANLAQHVQTVAGSCGTTMDDAMRCLANSNDTATKEVLGVAITSAYSTSCVGEAASSNTFCQQFSTAIAAGQTPDQIAEQFLNQYR